MARFGYMLLDTKENEVSRQALQLDTIGGFTRIFIERWIDNNKNNSTRDQRSKMLAALKQDDIVYVAAVDRICSNMRDFLQFWTDLEKKDCALVILEENFDSRSAAGKQGIRLVRSFTDLEFRFQSDRKKAGIRKARETGRRIGRPPAAVPPDFRAICRAWSSGEINGQEAIRQSGMRSTSFYKKAAELGFKPAKRNSNHNK